MGRIIATTVFLALAWAAPSYAQEKYLAEIFYTGANFCPRGTAECNGQILPIAQNTALFSLLGTTYGGNGQTTFSLPDLRGRTPVHTGQGPGLSNYDEGQTGGTETVTLTINNLPAHTHSLNAVDGNAAKTSPTGNLLSKSGTYRAGGTSTQLNQQSIGITGGSQPFTARAPFLALKACIVMEGIYPSRN